MNDFRKFVNTNDVWFRGRLPESDSTLDEVEKELGHSIPEDIRWLLKEYGYWHGTGIPDIRGAIQWTRDAKEHLDLPSHFIVLDDRQDGGIILLDTRTSDLGENRVYDSGYESIPNHLEEEIIYENYLEYVKSEIESKESYLDAKDIPYLGE